MNFILSLYIFCAGLILGSFVGVCIDRIPRGETVVFGRSHCPKCGTALGALDMVPVLSFLFLRGRCRHCGCRLSMRYPAVELLTGASFLAVYGVWGVSFRTLLLCLMACALIAAAFIDHDCRIIPDRIQIFLLLVGIAACLLDQSLSIWERLIGFFIVSLPMLLIACAVSGFGGGDIKLTAVCGLILGWKAILAAMLAASVSAALYAMWLMLFHKKSGLESMAFGPFLAVGIYAAALFANPLIGWYVSLFS